MAPSKEKARARDARYRKRNPEARRNTHLKHRYGISLDQYNALLESQGGVCAICKQPESRQDKEGTPQRLSVDHCHSHQHIRGLLCASCNKGLGLFQDNPILLRSAIKYLVSWYDAPGKGNSCPTKARSRGRAAAERATPAGSASSRGAVPTAAPRKKRGK